MKMPRDEIEPAAISSGRRSKRAELGGRIATGNRLRDGVVVYLDSTGAWTPEVNNARIATTAQEDQALQDALDSVVKSNFLIDAAVIDVRASDTAPAWLREQIRAVGPTVRPDLARRKPL